MCIIKSFNELIAYYKFIVHSEFSERLRYLNIHMEVRTITERNKVQPDPVMKDYWRNNRRFADLINGCLFEGEQVIHAEDLAAYDTDESTIISGRGEKKMTILRNRDILKMCVPEAGFVLIGVENQQKVHGYMPLRIAVYDILDYVKQQRQWEEAARQEGDQKNRRVRQKKETKLVLSGHTGEVL